MYVACFFYLLMTVVVFWLVISLVRFVQKKKMETLTVRQMVTQD